MVKTTSDLAILTAPVMHCGVKAEADIDEVDIGVGTQHHIRGYFCTKCGAGYSVCSGCGVPEDDRPHWSWCEKVG